MHLRPRYPKRPNRGSEWTATANRDTSGEIETVNREFVVRLRYHRPDGGWQPGSSR